MAKKRDKSIAIKVVELILAAFIVKGLGFVREMVLANYYGTSYVSDVFVAVQNIPAIIFTVFAVARSMLLWMHVIRTEKLTGK